jgi:predicted flap endonuclease-1-like 5' DNA nuclease
MSHYFIELALQMLAVFFIGCIIGWLLRRMFGTIEKPAAETIAADPMPMAAPAAPPAPPPRPSVAQWAPRPTAPPPVPTPTGKIMPIGLPAPRNGRADDLKRISGVGEKYERTLNALGFYHFDQIAAWNPSEMDWMDDYLQFNGRIKRENWVEQCQLLAAGDEQEFTRLYGTGGLRNAQGQTEAGLNTRKA